MAYDFGNVLNRVNGTKGRGNSVMLLEFLKGKRGSVIANHQIQTDAMLFLMKMYNKTVSPDTLSRLWRNLREEYLKDKENSKLHKSGISVYGFKKDGYIQKYYKIGYANE
tara:strand:+ start:324 stop:653 length:330 start_codon:yes stop_codon:yes gene_type:complete